MISPTIFPVEMKQSNKLFMDLFVSSHRVCLVPVVPLVQPDLVDLLEMLAVLVSLVQLVSG